MDLIKNTWSQSDKSAFLEHLKQFSRTPDKCMWEKRIINTQYDCLGILSKDIKSISNQIAKGNYISFLDLQIYDNFPAISIMGNLICKISNFKTIKYYLDLYSEKIDNWANCDQLKFKITSDNKNNFMSLIEEYILSPLPFRRRIALIILFQFINQQDIAKVLKIANSLYHETHYYVNMANAWLLCDCYIKFKNNTEEFLQSNHKLNNFTLNKMISKCCDSYRINNEDKEKLKQMRNTNTCQIAPRN